MNGASLLMGSVDGRRWMAEREGFEPSVRIFSLRRFSKPLPSATRPPLHDQLHRGLSAGGQSRQRGYVAHERADITSAGARGTSERSLLSG